MALLQIGAARTGSVSPIAVVFGSTLSFIEGAISSGISGTRNAATTVAALPGLERANAALTSGNQRLTVANARLAELASASAQETALRPIERQYGGIEARVIGFPPENESRAVTIDRGSRAGVRRDDGVVTAQGIVGRVVMAGPFSSTVLLATDYTSRIPAVVRRGRWWGIARGNLSSVVLEYIEQDAPLRVGDVIVTGEGRSFHSGIPIGTIAAIERDNSNLYQTAVLKTSVDLGALDRVVVVPQ